MHIVIAPDSFKGSLTAKEVALSIQEVVKNVFPEASNTLLPFSDGGEGALSVLQQFTKGKLVVCKTSDPLGRQITAPYYVFDGGKSAWIELSQSSGLTLLKPSERNPLATSTFGTGILIKDALKKGCKNIYLGIGGSATHDLGTGIFLALGGQLLDTKGTPIALGGGELNRCTTFDKTGLDPTLKTVRFVVACDVNNPLLGPVGAAFTYAAQKGASPNQIEQLERNGRYLASVIAQQWGIKVEHIPGGGAAGGTAAGLVGLLNGTLENGFSLLSKLTALEEKIKKASLVITGEGHFDEQSRFGKVPFRIASLTEKYEIPTIILAGKVSFSKKQWDSDRLGVYAIKPEDMPLETAMQNTPHLIHKKLTVVLETFKKNQKLI